MKNMKIVTKLALSFATMSLLSVILGIIAFFAITTLGNAIDDMYVNKAKPLGDLTTATEYFQRLRVQANKVVIYTGNTEQLATIERDINDRFNQFETSMADYKLTLASDSAGKVYSEIMDSYNKSFKPQVCSIIEKAKIGASADELLADIDEINKADSVISNDMSTLVQARMEVMSSANDKNKSIGNQLLMYAIAYVVVALGVSTIFCLKIPLAISNPVVFTKEILLKIGTKGDLTFTKNERELMEKYSERKDETGESIAMLMSTVERLTEVGNELGSVADGDLTTEINLLSDKDTMGLSLQKMVNGLNSMFHNISTSGELVSSGSKQISQGAQVLAQGSTEQAAAVEQLTSSLADISNKIKTNADTANNAATLADTIKQNAERGYLQMEEMITAVNDINQACQSISKVIKVIDDIAFQTNILALNAAVEAARAGTSGKGFAVVADEVRSLAAKSAEAAKDTGGLITNSIEKAELGVHIANATGKSLSEIVEGINKSAALVSEIAKSSDEQSTGISQIDRGIIQVAQVIQQNNAAAEESASASEEMSGQADTLEGLIALFKLKSNR